MHVKICGITNPDDAREAARYGADFVGLILAPSARRVTLEAAQDVLSILPREVEPILLFRDAPQDEVLAALEVTDCGWVQLHGCEPVSYLGQLARRRGGLRIIKAWEVSAPRDGDDLADYLRQAGGAGVRIDVVILDTPKGGPHPGYERLADIARRLRDRPPQIWCAGGLTPANVAAAVESGQYDGVDEAGGVESRPGIKDRAALRQFIETAKRL